MGEQVRVNGILYGGWGRENYGTKPIKVEALEVCAGCSLIDMLICVQLHHVDYVVGEPEMSLVCAAIACTAKLCPKDMMMCCAF